MRVGAFELEDSVPELHNTRAIAMLRPWIDVGRVGTLVLTKLEQHMGAKELGRLARPGTFFDFTRLRPRTRIVDGRRVLTTPNSIVHYGQDEGTNRDYMFLHLREPHAMGEDYTDAIVTLLKHFDVKEYCRIGGMYDSVPHSRALLVTGSLNEAQAEQAKGLVSPRTNTYQGPTSIVNLVAEALAQSEVATTSLMVSVPQYAQLDEDHMGASRLLEVLCAIYGLPSSLADPTRGQQQYQEIGRAVEHNPDARNLVQQLEADYDHRQDKTESEGKPQFSPDVEKFLGDMGQRLEDNDDNE